jgi:hypothetical protein
MPTAITTEYKQTAKLKDNEIDLLQSRMQNSILDVIVDMRKCRISEKENSIEEEKHNNGNKHGMSKE